MSKKLALIFAGAVFLVFGLLIWSAAKINDSKLSQENLADNQPVASHTGNEPQTGAENSKDALPEEIQTTIKMVEFVQITIMRLDAGEQTFEAFRILRRGTVERAQWSSSGHLIDYSEPSDMGSETFNRVVFSSSFLNPPESPQNKGVLGRPAFRLDIAILSESGVQSVSMATMPGDIAELVDEIRRSVKEKIVQPGWYIWTQPYPQIGKADIDLSEAGSDSAIAKKLAEAIATGRLIVRADNSIQSFVSGERAYRIAFEAKLAIGNLLFGVLSPK